MSTTILRTPLVWECGFCDDETALPAEYYPAEVPGAVQLDYARAHGWGPFWLEKDPSVYAFMEDKFWCYRATLSIGGDREGAVLVFCGIDYRCRIRVDGDTLYEGEGMFSELRLDVSRYRVRRIRWRCASGRRRRSRRFGKDGTRRGRAVNRRCPMAGISSRG